MKRKMKWQVYNLSTLCLAWTTHSSKHKHKHTPIMLQMSCQSVNSNQNSISNQQQGQRNIHLIIPNREEATFSYSLTNKDAMMSDLMSRH